MPPNPTYYVLLPDSSLEANEDAIKIQTSFERDANASSTCHYDGLELAQHEVTRNGIMLNYLSSSHCVVYNPGKVKYAAVTLELVKQTKVYVKLIEKVDEHAKSEARTRLLIEKRPNLHINYQHVFSESILSLKLDKLDEDYEVKVTLPPSILVEDQNQSTKTVSSQWSADDNNGESPFVDVQTHHRKCKTGGCMFVGVRSYRGLCSSCYKTWVELLRGDENKDFDSISSDENSDQKCKNRSCKNQGETQYYGFCFQCFHSSFM